MEREEKQDFSRLAATAAPGDCRLADSLESPHRVREGRGMSGLPGEPPMPSVSVWIRSNS